MLTKQSDDFSKWYNDIILRAELADYAPIKGCMIIRPYGYAIWENIQKVMDVKIKKLGVNNVYFPLFIPEKFFKKEAEHVEGFNPQVAWITHGGGKKLEEKLAIRPTSETVMYDAFSDWIHSHRDLPFKVNQWANIVRWEMRTRLFLRTMEFLWQEGHTAHATEKEADEMTKTVLKMYNDFAEEYLGIYCIPGEKTESEKFPGAKYTLTFEALMKDGKALQMGTSHQLGQEFAKSFNIQFLDEKGNKKYVWQTSWGVSTRMIGGIVMAHGDDKGLILPPKLAQYPIVIIPITYDSKIFEYIEKIEKIIRNKQIDYFIDKNEQQTPGWKFNEWELKGAPLRIEIGPKEVKENKITYASRDLLKKENIDLKQFDPEKLLNAMQKRLYEKSKEFTIKNIRKVKSYKEFKKILENNGGFIKAHWCGNPKCEKEIQEETKATIRCIPFDQKNKKDVCIKCAKEGKYEVLFAKSY
ncbi:MAG TPA: proline--tRNA ligase [Candidatus Portnoybacteria bacterium]|jgi:prolyl-tRNA synthetase|nr:proline--tRNA ligase [Candidatus Portnoybacteria bacterium]MDD5752222.1 proline--tRNA ligase [Candidatus Portnoybacteria bacterium]HNU96762.1 proline--tRNA ligase [Candidatus Portnoybacteria bacterium]HOZ16486.1 proline--tRNA ligase [Candidatus Portnoybacteria bacterium]HPH52246.1 proline--tRNA ligase [Candidatus Portnoybacteria bacterium]